MSGFTPTKPASTIFRDFVVDGNPGSGAQQPVKADVRTYGTEIEAALDTHDDALAMARRTTPQGRLSLTTAVPVLISDVLAATTIYYTPYVGDLWPYYDGTDWQLAALSSDLSLPLDSNAGHTGYHQSGKNFDLFVFDDSGTKRLGSGPAWSFGTARGTGAGTTELQRKNGLWTNKNSIVLRWGANSGDTSTIAANRATYVGSFRASADGQTAWVAQPAAAAGGGACTIYLWNAFNRRPVAAYSRDSTDSWNYTTATWRSANNNSNNRISFLRGLDEDPIDAEYIVDTSNSTTTINRANGIGLGSTSAPDAACGIGLGAGVTGHHSLISRLGLIPGLGFNFVQALEWSTATGTTTWYGDNGGGAPPTQQLLKMQMAA